MSMSKDEAKKIANTQYDNYVFKISGAWSLAEDEAKKLVETLGLDWDDAVSAQEEAEMNDLHEFINNKLYNVRNDLAEVSDSLPDNLFSDLLEIYEDKYWQDFHSDPSKSEYFWEFIVSEM